MRWAFDIKESCLIAWEAIRANRLRSSLTALGIIVGIVTVTLMGMALEGLNISFRDNLAKLGTETLYVQRLPWQIRSYAEWLRYRNRQEFDWFQARQLERRITNAAAAALLTETRLTVKYRERSGSQASVVGTTADYEITSGIEMAEGRFLSAQECDGGRPLCVIGSLVASNLFVNESPLGKRLHIDNETVEIVGVMSKRGSFMGEYSFDNQVLVPAKYFVDALKRGTEFSMQIKARNASVLPALVEEVRAVMRLLRRVPPSSEDDFAINQQQTILESFERVTTLIGSVGFFISGLSLLVGGIGIMNIMFVSVAERTREIGVRKAIGAKRRVILIQFLTEAATLCLLAGLAGLALAWLISRVIASTSPLPVVMSPAVAAMAIGVSVAVGLISGFLPAWRAARMNPVDALRNE